MEVLIKTLNDALTQTNTVLNRLNKERRENDILRDQNRNESANLNTRALRIIELEKKYDRIKSVELWEEQVKIDSQKLKKSEAKHEANIKALIVQKNMMEAEHKDRMKVIDDKIEEYNRKFIALEKEKKAYKEDIQRTIDLQLKARGISL